MIEGYSLFYKEDESWSELEDIYLDFGGKLIRKEIIKWYYKFLLVEKFDIYVLLKAGFHLISLYVRDYEIEEKELTTIALAALHIIHSLLGQTVIESMDISQYTSFIIFKELGVPYSPKLEILPDELWNFEIKMMEYPIYKFLRYLDNRELSRDEDMRRVNTLLDEIRKMSR